MWVLIKHELKRFFKSKFSLIFIALILALNIFLGINYKNYSNNNNLENTLKIPTEGFIKSLEENLELHNKRLNEIGDNPIDESLIEEKQTLLTNIDYDNKSLSLQTELLTAINNNDNRTILKLRLEEIKSINNILLPSSSNQVLTTNQPERFAKDFLSEFMYQYLYDNNIDVPIDVFHNYSALDLLLDLFKNYYVIILPILFLIVASTSISGECSNNTYKLLFSQPIKKYKIITSKIVSSFVISLFFIFLATISTIIIGTLLNGFGNPNYPILMFDNLTNKIIDPFSIVKSTHIEPTKVVLVKLISYFLLVSLFINSMAILISSLFKNKLTSIITAIIIFVGTYFTAPIITGIKAFNPMTYLNAYEIVTGISSLTEPKIQLTFGIILLSSLLIIFTILSTLKVKKLHL